MESEEIDSLITDILKDIDIYRLELITRVFLKIHIFDATVAMKS